MIPTLIQFEYYVTNHANFNSNTNDHQNANTNANHTWCSYITISSNAVILILMLLSY